MLIQANIFCCLQLCTTTMQTRTFPTRTNPTRTNPTQSLLKRRQLLHRPAQSLRLMTRRRRTLTARVRVRVSRALCPASLLVSIARRKAFEEAVEDLKRRFALVARRTSNREVACGRGWIRPCLWVHKTLTRFIYGRRLNDKSMRYWTRSKAGVPACHRRRLRSWCRTWSGYAYLLLRRM